MLIHVHFIISGISIIIIVDVYYYSCCLFLLSLLSFFIVVFIIIIVVSIIIGVVFRCRCLSSLLFIAVVQTVKISCLL